MSYCKDCIHYKVCGNEGVDDSAMTFCADKKTSGDLISQFRDYQIEWLTSHNDLNLHETEMWVVQFLKDTAECFLKTELPSAEKTYGDLIAEIDKLPRIKVGNSNSPTVKYCIDEVLLYDLLENMPSTEKTAEWTKDDECSNCGKYVYVGDRDNYCPHCGYRMKGAE